VPCSILLHVGNIGGPGSRPASCCRRQSSTTPAFVPCPGARLHGGVRYGDPQSVPAHITSPSHPRSRKLMGSATDPATTGRGGRCPRRPPEHPRALWPAANDRVPVPTDHALTSIIGSAMLCLYSGSAPGPPACRRLRFPTSLRDAIVAAHRHRRLHLPGAYDMTVSNAPAAPGHTGRPVSETIPVRGAVAICTTDRPSVPSSIP